VSIATFNAMQTLMGIAPAHAAAADAAAPNEQAVKASTQAMPGALGQPQEAGAIIDHRYLWDAAGNLRYVQHSAGEPRTSAYAYDEQDRLIVAQTKADAVQASAGAKVQPVSTAGPSNIEAKPAHLEQYFYDAQGRRVLAQSDGVTSKTRFDKASHRWVEDGSGKDNNIKASYDQAGQPQAIGSKTYQWDAAGRLIKTTDANEKGSNQTTYAYDHRGLRNTKHATGQTTHYLHDESKQLQAELNDQGQLTRQYVHLADQPLATIDTPSGQNLSSAQASQLSQVVRDITTIIHGWISSSKGEQITWLHLNHLGAPEAATDTTANVIWQASYQSFGRASVKATSYTLNIRLPGQYEDQESGLHYNRQRYYDPAKGSYLTPDPSGNPDGANSYAYVRYNPLKYVDPDGLVLFAFDGTDNTDDEDWLRQRGSSVTNVVQFRRAYDTATNGAARYVTGVGTDHANRDSYGNIISSTYDTNIVVGTIPDRGGNYSGPDRITRMMRYFADEVTNTLDQDVMQIDIVGFSRGAAQARVFANNVTTRSRQVNDGGTTYMTSGMVQVSGQNGEIRNYYRLTTFDRDQVNRITNVRYQCQLVNFRFMGLFDTVLATNRSGTNYNMGIPSQFAHVAQAVALNEYRSAPAGNDAFWTAPQNFNFWNRTRTHLPSDNHYGGFQLESIGASSTTPGQVRVEQGFIGAHADIGGGYGSAENGLSTVALNWMVAQAQVAGVGMLTGNLPTIDMNSPILHDQSNAIRWGNPLTAVGNVMDSRGNVLTPEDRVVVGATGGRTQRAMTFNNVNPMGTDRSLTNAETHQFIRYWDRDPVTGQQRDTNSITDTVNLRNRTGSVDMQAYMSWLRGHGYVFARDF
jgi:RHS repeat-associated protein